MLQIRTNHRVSGILFLFLFFIALLSFPLMYPANAAHGDPSAQKSSKWMAGDFHTHSGHSNGGHSLDDILANAFGGKYATPTGFSVVPGFGLDWIAISDHGGESEKDPMGIPWTKRNPPPVFLGNPPGGAMWMWQSLRDFSYPLVASARSTYPEKLIIQGYEWNVPGHGHAGVGIVGRSENAGLAIAQHTYLFDADDTGTSSDSHLGVNGKLTTDDHARAMAGAVWLQQNYPHTSYFLLNHPSRSPKYSAAHIRDFNNAAPDVAFGFEGMPGHQRAPARGDYDRDFCLSPNEECRYGLSKRERLPDPPLNVEKTAKARTYGGADMMLARVGGLWDALLGEGRHFWVFANSDFHSNHPTEGFYPGEYGKTYTLVRDENRDGFYSIEELLGASRSGNSFAVHGDLIHALDFRAKAGDQTATMGETLPVSKGDEVLITIRYKSPEFNNNHDHVRVDHVDLIAGEVTGKIPPFLEDGISPNPAYSVDSNRTARVIARFTAGEMRSKDGWFVITHVVNRVDRDTYFRLRGTNLGLGVPNETDGEGNPLVDDLMGRNDTAKAYRDLWFYSNPVFVRVSDK